jgi:hypothetical protein
MCKRWPVLSACPKVDVEVKADLHQEHQTWADELRNVDIDGLSSANSKPQVTEQRLRQSVLV